MTEEQTYLPGGSGGVWRVRDAAGQTRVHRPTGPWTPAVHELLRHLEARGLDGIPRVLGIDDDGREVLSYLPGDSVDPERDTVSDAALEAAAAWLRRFHDAVGDFRPGPRDWRSGASELRGDQVICHNDPGVTNWVLVHGAFAGMIDWDRAGPGRPVEDLAFMCWSGVPLLREIPTVDAARRIALAARAYGGIGAEELLDAVQDRLALIADRWRVGLDRKDPGTIALRDAGIMDRHLARVAGFERRLPAIQAELRSNWLG